MEYDQVKFAIQAHVNQNRPLSRHLQEMVDNEPELEMFDDFYMVAFWRLVSEKRGGPRIPHSEIDKYGRREGLDSDMIPIFIHVIWTLDSAYTGWIQSKQDEQRRMSQS